MKLLITYRSKYVFTLTLSTFKQQNVVILNERPGDAYLFTISTNYK